MNLEEAINSKIKTLLDKNREANRISMETARNAAVAKAAQEAAAASAAAEEAKRVADEAARKAAEEAASADAAQKAEAAAEAARKAEEEAEATRVAAVEAAEEAAAASAAAEEEKRLADEAEAKRVADEAEAKRVADEAETKKKTDAKDLIDKISAIAAAVAVKAFADAKSTPTPEPEPVTPTPEPEPAPTPEPEPAPVTPAPTPAPKPGLENDMAAISAAAVAAYSNNNQKPPRTIEECEAKVQALKQKIIDLTKKQVCDLKTIESLRKNQADLLAQTDALNTQIHTIRDEYSRVLNQNGLPDEVVERQTQNMNELLERMDEFLDSFHRVNASMAAKSTDLRAELGQFIAKLEALQVTVPEQLTAIRDANTTPDINEVRDAVMAAIAAANQSQEAMIQELNASIEELRTKVDTSGTKVDTSGLATQVTELTALVKTQAKTIADIKQIQDECFGAFGASEKHVPTSFAQISSQLDELTKAIQENMDRSSTDSNTRMDALTKQITELKTLVGSGPGPGPELEPDDEAVVDVDGARTFVSQQNGIATGDLDHMATINGNIYFFTHKPTGKLYKYPTSKSQ